MATTEAILHLLGIARQVGIDAADGEWDDADGADIGEEAPLVSKAELRDLIEVTSGVSLASYAPKDVAFAVYICEGAIGEQWDRRWEQSGGQYAKAERGLPAERGGWIGDRGGSGKRGARPTRARPRKGKYATERGTWASQMNRAKRKLRRRKAAGKGRAKPGIAAQLNKLLK